MESVIACLAWLGLIVLSAVAGLLLYASAGWAWGAAIEVTGNWLGYYHATIFYLGLTLQPKEKRGWYAGNVLAMRYRRLKEFEPEVAEEFEKSCQFQQQKGSGQ
jgi:hypothetical protein